MKRGLGRGLRGVVAAALLLGAARAQAQSEEAAKKAATAEIAATGPLVTETRIVDADGSVIAEAPAGIPVATGKALDRDQVAQSLLTLYQTGDYATIEAVTTPENGGVRLDFVVQRNFYFNEVQIEGLTPPPSEASAAAAMQLTLGHVYRKSTLDESLEKLRETLKEDGLYQAKLKAENLPHAETRQMDIIVHVEPGKRAKVSSVTLINGTEYRDDELLSKLKLKVGDELTAAKVQRGTARIRKFLVKKRHLSARAVVRRGEYDAAKNEVPLELEVSEGPRVRVEVTGAKFSGGTLKKLVPIFQEGAVDADLLEEGKRNIQERLEREAYFDAQVSYKTETRPVKEKRNGWQGTEEVITYEVKRGEKHKLVGIAFKGNHYFGTELLESRLQIYGGAFGATGKFSQRLIESDEQSIQNLYQSNGFEDAKVETKVLDDYEGKNGDLYVEFDIQEGTQTRVASLKIEGNHAFTEDQLLGVVGATAGQPYSDFSVATDRANILAMYFNEGFPEAQFKATAQRVPAKKESGEQEKQAPKTVNGGNEGHDVALVYEIDEGPQTRVKRVLISGEVHTRPGVIRREIEIKPGEPLREGDVVESQRRLYNLGIFNRVTIEPQNPAGTDTHKNVVALVEEAKRYTISYGGGFEVQRLASSSSPTGAAVQAAPRGILEVTKNNLTGRADSLSLKLRGSTLQGRALLGYSDPNTFGKLNYSFQATTFAEKTQDINTFTQTRYEQSVQLTDQRSRLTTLLYRYAFRKVLVTDLKIPTDEVPLFNQPTLVSQFGMTWIRDARDNPADATKGTFNSADISVADTAIGSSASFLRFFFQNSTYHPIKRRFSFARSTRLGILAPYRDTVSLSFPPPTTGPVPTVIPLPERFFAGGGTSLRGFALNQAGPRDSTTGFPVGGQALLVLNQEFRFPMRLPYFGTQLGGAIFYDGGNVYSRLSRISFRARLPKPVFALADPSQPESNTNQPVCVANCSNELNYFAHTIGFGIRYATPVGPIRIDLGYQLNRPYFVIPCKNGIAGCQQATRVPGFQIFFNLGSTF